MTTSTPAHPFNAPLKRKRTPMTVEAKRARAALKANAVTQMHRYGVARQPFDKITGSQPLPANPLTINDLKNPSSRPGSMRALGIPTRIGDWLHYRDGNREFDPIQPNPIVNPYL